MQYARFVGVFGALALLQGCGARTIADEYRDGGVTDAPPGDAPQDVPVDVPEDAPVDVLVDLPVDVPVDLPPTCRAGQVRCPGGCADLTSDLLNCGRCGVQCGPSASCVLGACAVEPACPAGQRSCGGRCVDLFGDAMNCGACGRACAAGQRCAAGACEPVTMTGPALRIESLTANNCVVVEHAMVTGDDRGGIALGPRQVFYTGDTQTAGFDLDRLAPATGFMRPLDGILGDVSLPQPATLASNRVPLDERTSIVDALLRVNDDGTLGPTPSALSSVIFLDRASPPAGGVGVFSGAGRAIVVAGSRAWVLDAARVTELAVRPIGPHQGCETWAFWGVAEFFEGAPWVAYVRDTTSVARQNLLTGEVRTVATFSNLSDMCSFTVDPRRNRWYFHHEGASQFRSGDETLGYCDARITSF